MSRLTKRELDAMAILAERSRIMVILVPDDVPTDFVKHLTLWSNFLLDTKLTPPLPLPVAEHGDGLVCPYCGLPATSAPDAHAPGCVWREAIYRWAAGKVQIEEERAAEEKP